MAAHLLKRIVERKSARHQLLIHFAIDGDGRERPERFQPGDGNQRADGIFFGRQECADAVEARREVHGGFRVPLALPGGARS